MAIQATYEDVNLILRLYELRREDKLRAAREWFARNYYAGTTEEFQTVCPPGSDQHTYFRMMIGYWEMAASFVTNGVLNKELFFQSSGELLLTYERIRTILPAMRDLFKNPKFLHNLETVAKDYIAWMNENAPEAYVAFAARMGAPQR